MSTDEDSFLVRCSERRTAATKTATDQSFLEKSAASFTLRREVVLHDPDLGKQHLVVDPHVIDIPRTKEA